jgi:hypothetical protein
LGGRLALIEDQAKAQPIEMASQRHTAPVWDVRERWPSSCANDCGRVAMIYGLTPRLGDAIRQCVIRAGGRGDLHAGPTGKSGWLPEESASIACLSLWRAEALCFLRAAAAFVACDARFFALVRLQWRARGTLQGALLYASLNTMSGLLVFTFSNKGHILSQKIIMFVKV